MPMMKFLLSAQEKQNQMSSVSSYQEAMRANPLSEHGGRNALGIGFRIWVKSKFNHSQQEAINAASREYGSGGFTLVKGPPGTGKTTTLAALVNALHLRQYQKYYAEIEKITLSMDSNQKSSNDISEFQSDSFIFLYSISNRFSYLFYNLCNLSRFFRFTCCHRCSSEGKAQNFNMCSF
jgi:chromosomal replication initiation ATPase DnaA